jgi:hypothetical protein
MGTLEFTVGRLFCGQIREFLKIMKFKGANIEWMESSGWIDRTFVVKGNSGDLQTIARTLDEWKKSYNKN